MQISAISVGTEPQLISVLSHLFGFSMFSMDLVYDESFL